MSDIQHDFKLKFMSGKSTTIWMNEATLNYKFTNKKNIVSFCVSYWLELTTQMYTFVLKKKVKKLSGVRLLGVTRHMSLRPLTTANDPPPANSSNIYSKILLLIMTRTKKYIFIFPHNIFDFFEPQERFL